MNRAQAERTRAFRRVEEAVAELLFCVARLNANDLSIYDRKARRRELLEAAREYGAAMRSLARPR